MNRYISDQYDDYANRVKANETVDRWLAEEELKHSQKPPLDIAAHIETFHGEMDNYFEAMHKRVKDFVITVRTEMVQRGFYRDGQKDILLVPDTEYNYKFTMLSIYFRPLFDDNTFYVTVPLLFGYRTWEELNGAFDKDYSKSKEIEYFAKNNPWFHLTLVSIAHGHWKNKMPIGKDYGGHVLTHLDENKLFGDA